MEKFEKIPRSSEQAVVELPDSLPVDTEQVALRGAGRLSEVLGLERFTQQAAENRANGRMNYRWALRQFGSVPRA